MRIATLKWLDRSIGRAFVTLIPKASVVLPEIPPSSILVIRPGGIGDAVLLVPAIQVLKKKYPDTVIDVLSEKRNAPIFKMCPDIDKILRYDQGGLLQVLRCRYDVVIDSEQWHRLTAVLSRLVRAGVRIGFGTNERRKLYSHVIDYHQDRPELQSFFDLLQPLAVESLEGHSSNPFLEIPGEENQRTEQLLGDFLERRYIVLFPGASIPERRWGAEQFHRLALQLNHSGRPIVVIGGEEDRETGAQIVAGVDGLNLAGRTTLIGSAAVIEKAALLVSGDSGMLHVGIGLGKPTVSLFGSGIAAKWAPKGGSHVVINKQLACSPCTIFGTTPPCPIQVKCLKDISADEVLSAALSLLKR